MAKKVPAKAAPEGRRKRYAEQTRDAIVNAARELFAKRGYAATTVEEIARKANVAAVTIYTTVGGKSGLLQVLTDLWSSAPIIEEGMQKIGLLKSGHDVIR